MPSLVEFLRHVLPSEGFYCYWFKDRQGKPKQGFTPSLEELADTLMRIDAAGLDAFFACSTYKNSTKRTQENVKLVQSLWLDIDAGPGKPYPSAEAACEALDAFCEQAQLPVPTVVYSGGGIHAYWRNGQMLDRRNWEGAAAWLGALVARLGLRADASRTEDCASILRPPGSHNYKIPGCPRPVDCPEILEGQIEFPNDAPRGENAPPPQWGPQTLDMNQAATGGMKSAAPNMLQGYPDGHRTDELLRRIGWCLGPQKLGEEETLQACLAWNKHNTPPLDETKIQSTVASISKREAAKMQVHAKVPIPETFPQPIEGYQLDQYYRLFTEIEVPDKNGVPVKQRKIISRWPVYLNDVRKGETDGSQDYVLRQWNPDEGWKEVMISAKDWHGSQRWGVLAYYGLKIHEAAQKMFAKYIDKQWDILSGKKTMRYDQFGWKDDYTAFFIGGSLYKNDGTVVPCAGTKEIQDRAAKMTLSKEGNLAGWTNAANRFFGDGMESISYALLSSFSAPLMVFNTPPGEGGAILSLVSPGSGTGKSTALTGIATVWGELDAIKTTTRDTEVALFRSIGTLCHVPIAMDELREFDKDRAPARIVSGFTVGRDKQRGRVDGSVAPITLGWKTLLISASNRSLIDALQKDGDDPMACRVFEISITPPKDVKYSFGIDFQNELVLNRGYAGRKYISYLLQPGVVDTIRKHISEYTKHFAAYLGAQQKDRFLVRQIANTWVADPIIRHLGILDYDSKRIREWSLDMAREAMKGFSTFDPVSTLASIVNEYTVTDCIVVQDEFKPGKNAMQILTSHLPTRSPHMRYEIATKKLYVQADWMKHQLRQRGQPWQQVAGALRDMGVLLDVRRQATLGAGTTMMTSRTTCWLIDYDNTILGENVIKVVEQIPLSPLVKGV